MKTGHTYYILLLLLILGSCTQSEFPTVREPDKDDVEADFVISFSKEPSTYALDDDKEVELKEVTVLAFKVDGGTETFAQAASTTDFIISGNNQQFTVSLKRSTEQHRFVIIANANSAVSPHINTVGVLKDALLEKIISENSGKWNTSSPFKPLPMWGESAQTSIISESLLLGGPIQLLRAVARIDLSMGGFSRFKISDVYVYNTKTKGRLVPDKDKLITAGATAGQVRYPSMPSNVDIHNLGPLHYDVPVANELAYKQNIYLYEVDSVPRGHDLDAFCLVIGGFYKGPTDPDFRTDKSFYRVDFTKPSLEWDDKNYYSNILRNHLYNIKIMNVSDEGYKTPEEAFVNVKTNMTVEIESWLMGESQYNGVPYNFMISRNLFENIGSSLFTGSFVLTTDDPSGWSSVATPGVTLSPSSGTQGAEQNVSFVVEDTAPLPITISITAGQITKKITITR